MAGTVPGMGDAASDSQLLQLLQLAAQAVVDDRLKGGTFSGATTDLNFAQGYFAQIDPSSPIYSQAQATMNMAQANYNAFAATQSEQQGAALGIATSQGAVQKYYASGGQPVNIGSPSGSELTDTLTGIANDVTGGYAFPDAVGMPGANTGFGGGQGTVGDTAGKAACSAVGGTWDAATNSCKSIFAPGGGNGVLCGALGIGCSGGTSGTSGPGGSLWDTIKWPLTVIVGGLVTIFVLPDVLGAYTAHERASEVRAL